MNWSADAFTSAIGECKKNDRYYYTFAITAGFFLPLIILVINYSMVFKVAFTQAKKLQQLKSASSMEPAEISDVDISSDPRPSVISIGRVERKRRKSIVRELKATKTLAIVIGTFIVCWLPTFVLSVVRTVSGTESVHRGHLLPEIAMFGTFINEATNPIIYCAFDRSLKARVSLRRICPHLTESAGSSQNANQTNYIANEHILNQAYVRNLHVILQSNQPHDNSARNTVNTAESREMVIVDRD